MLTIGRLCMKICGRDAGKKCVIVDILDNNLVLIDGATRRRKCNILHLEPLTQELDIKKGASHEEVVKVFKELKLEFWESKPKEAKERPKKSKKKKVKPEPKKGAKKAEVKKVETKEAKAEPVKETKKKEDTKQLQDGLAKATKKSGLKDGL